MDGMEVLGRPMIVRLNKFEADQYCYVPPIPKLQDGHIIPASVIIAINA